MKFTKMNVTGQLSPEDSGRFAQRVGLSYVIAAVSSGFIALAALVYAIRWW